MTQSVQDLMIQKNYFYRDNYRRLMSYLLVLLLLAIGLGCVLGYLTWEKQVPKYYASTTTGEVIELHSLSEPVISNSHLLEWSALVVRQAYSLSFLNYQQQLDQAKDYFSPGAWQKFNDALNSSGVLSTIKDKKLIMQTIVTSSPVITYSGVLHGRFTWRIQVPILVTYSSASEKQEHKMQVYMDVARVPVLNTPEGIQVVDFRVQEF